MEKNNTDDEYIGKHNNYKAELEQIIPMILEGLVSPTTSIENNWVGPAFARSNRNLKMMRKHIATLMLLLSAFYVIAQQQEANSLHVIGRAEIEVEPDLFDLNIGFTYTTISMETSIEEVNKAVDAMVKAITSNTEIKTTYNDSHSYEQGTTACGCSFE